MKTITAKELQTKSAAILRDVRDGQEYLVTYHRKPAIRLVPASVVKSAKSKFEPGSREAFLESLKHTFKASDNLQSLSHKELRARMIEHKYGQ